MNQIPKPEWLRVKAHSTGVNEWVEKILKEYQLNTVCDEAACPNRGECFSRKTATFMILGNICTRGCTFCNVTGGEPEKADKNEPERVAQAVKSLGLRHVVVTSVTRDDLPDGGAEHFVRVIDCIRSETPNVIIEVLIPDFQGNAISLEKVIKAHPHIINHNVETVPSLYRKVRPQADYFRSLHLLKTVKEKDHTLYTKSGMMVGFGEKTEEVLQVLKDLRQVGCDFLTIGQYLSPTKTHLPVVEYVHPERFQFYRDQAYEMGFTYVASGPLVRSSYMAEEALNKK